MKYKVNDKIDNVDVYTINENGPEKVKFLNLIEDKKVLLIGVPGAFTPTCSEQHLPGYVKLLDDFVSKGIQKIIFISVTMSTSLTGILVSAGGHLDEEQSGNVDPEQMKSVIE